MLDQFLGQVSRAPRRAEFGAEREDLPGPSPQGGAGVAHQLVVARHRLGDRLDRLGVEREPYRGEEAPGRAHRGLGAEPGGALHPVDEAHRQASTPPPSTWASAA